MARTSWRAVDIAGSGATSVVSSGVLKPETDSSTVRMVNYEDRDSRWVGTGRNDTGACIPRRWPRCRSAQPPHAEVLVARPRMGWRDPWQLATRDRRLRRRDQLGRP